METGVIFRDFDIKSPQTFLILKNRPQRMLHVHSFKYNLEHSLFQSSLPSEKFLLLSTLTVQIVFQDSGSDPRDRQAKPTLRLQTGKTRTGRQRGTSLRNG